MSEECKEIKQTCFHKALCTENKIKPISKKKVYSPCAHFKMWKFMCKALKKSYKA